MHPNDTIRKRLSVSSEQEICYWMRTPVVTVNLAAPLSEALVLMREQAAQLMIENKIGGLPVVDQDNEVVGIVTESDLFEALIQHLDELVDLRVPV